MGKPKPADAAVELDEAVSETIAAYAGDPSAAVKALLIANRDLEEELARAVVAGSNGYTRGWFRRKA